MTDYTRFYIGGEWVEPVGTGRLEVLDSATETVFATVPEGAPADIDRAVAAARAAFPGWSDRPPAARGAILAKVASLLEERRDEVADAVSHELGTERVGGLVAALLQQAGHLGQDRATGRGRPV